MIKNLLEIIIHGPWGRKKLSRKKLEWTIKNQSKTIKQLSDKVVELSKMLRDQDNIDFKKIDVLGEKIKMVMNEKVGTYEEQEDWWEARIRNIEDEPYNSEDDYCHTCSELLEHCECENDNKNRKKMDNTLEQKKGT